MERGLIFDISRYSIHDGPGIRTTVFFKGCPLYCLWCHNPESQNIKQEIFFWKDRCIGCGDCIRACPTGAINSGKGCTLCGACVDACSSGAREMVGRMITKQELLKEIERDTVFYDQSGGGVTFSGGEPLLQKDFLFAILNSCREKGIHTALDTTGFCPTDDILQISRQVDLFLYDIKLIDNNAHKKYTGVSNDIILKNLRELSKIHNGIIVRLPLIPQINDDDQNISNTGEFLASLHNISQVNILPYHNTAIDKYERLHRKYKLPNTEVPAPEKLEMVKKKLMKFGLQVQIGG